jgi:predicted MFS family arabinose efflux permease
MDVPGAVTVSLGLGALVLGVSYAAGHGWGSPLVLGLLVVAVLLLVAFWQIELRSSAPLASVRILRKPTVSLGNLSGLVTISMQSALIFLVTLYLQEVRSLSPTATGLVFGVLGAGAFVGGMTAPNVIGRLGNRNSIVLGLGLQILGPGGLLLIAGPSTPIAPILVILAIGAFGHVTTVVSYMVTGTSGLPDDEQGLAAGLAIMTQQVALAVGIPILSAVATGGIAATAGADTVMGGLRVALAVDAAVLLITLVFVGSLLGRRTAPAPEPAREPADSLSS